MVLDTFEERVRWARQTHAALTQGELRDRMFDLYGVSIGANYISEIELGKDKRPSFEVVRAMAGALGVSLDWLARFTEDIAPARDTTGPTYFSEEADRVAQIVDTMPNEQRKLLAAIAHNLAASTAERQLRLNDVIGILESIERELGSDARARVESIIRSRVPSTTNPAGANS